MSYQSATICESGHILSKTTANISKYCPKCGKVTYSVCPICKTPIRGYYYQNKYDFALPEHYELPYYCHACGSPYPWTETILRNAVELLALDSDLDDNSKELIKNAIPNLIVDTPDTPLAIAQYKSETSKAGEITRNCLTQLLINVVCEVAKANLFS